MNTSMMDKVGLVDSKLLVLRSGNSNHLPIMEDRMKTLEAAKKLFQWFVS